MAWPDDLRPASFRGIPFFIDDHDFSTGRHVVTHEYPERDLPYSEDLGRKAETFLVNGHVLGSDYFLIRDSLRAAAAIPGPGELIHPYLGTLQVNCTSFNIKEDTKEGRIAKISFSFVETGSNQFPSETIDRQAIIDANAEQLIANAKTSFLDKFSVLRQPGFVVQDARDRVADAAAKLEEATGPIRETQNELAELSFSLRNLVAESNDLVTNPASLADVLESAFDDLVAIAIDAGGALVALKATYPFLADLIDIPVSTTTREQQKLNRDSFKDYFETIAITKAAQQLPQQLFRSIDEAIVERDLLIEEILNKQLETDNDDLYQSFQDLAVNLAEAVPDENDTLPSVVNYDLAATINSVVLTYDLYESLDNEQDIIDRNNISHPGFIVGNQTLEVLSE